MKLCSLILLALLTIKLAAQDAPAEPPEDAKDNEVAKVAPADDREDASKLIGLQMSMQLQRQFFLNEIDLESLFQGIRTGMQQKMDDVDPEKAQETMNRFSQMIQAGRAAMLDANLTAGKEFLVANAKKEGVTELPSGLQYQVLESGAKSGKSPTLSQTVKCHYVGTLIDGTEFDSSRKRGIPAEFPIHNVIRGWTEALQLMRVGDTWRLFIPGKLAYQEQGAPPIIRPGATLIFEVELLEVKDTPQAKPTRGMP